MRLGFIWGAVV